jgi:hypothetical protein
MTVANATHGEVRFKGQKVAKIRSINMETQRQSLETTGVGEVDETFAYGKRTSSGSATLLYKTDDQPTVNLMNRIFDDGETPDDLVMTLYKGSNKYISGPVLINSQGIGTSVGDNTQISISFVIDGKPSKAF